MATTYSYIYEEFLDNITDPDLLLLVETEQENIKRAFLENAVRKCELYVYPKFDLSKRTVVTIDDDEYEAFEDDLDGKTIDLLTSWMAVAWLKPYMNNADLLRLHMNTKDFNTTSPANLVEKIGVRYDEARHRARSLTNEYTYIINDVSTLSTANKT